MNNIVHRERAAAALVGLAPGTLRNKRVTGDGPPYCKAGRSVVYREADLIAWLNARVRHSTSEQVSA